MKKIGLMMLGITGCFVLAGCQSWGNSSYEEKQYENTGNVQSLEINDDNMKINVVGVDDDQPLTINYHESEYETYKISEQGNKVSMKKQNRSRGWNIFSFFNWNFDDIELTVEVPEDQLKNLNITTKNGKIVVEGLTVKESRLKTTNGSLLVEDFRATDILKLETTNGKVELSDVQVKEGQIETTNAKINFDQLVIEDSFKAETTNGKIRGTIEGSQKDFEIESKTTNGDNNLENSGTGSKKLKLKTTNGSVRVDFSKD